MLLTPDIDLLLPEGGLELLPVLAVGCLDVSALLEQTLKDKVLDEISSSKNGSASVQCLEYLLSILASRQIDHHDLQQFAGAALDSLGAGHELFRTFLVEPCAA